MAFVVETVVVLWILLAITFPTILIVVPVNNGLLAEVPALTFDPVILPVTLTVAPV